MTSGKKEYNFKRTLKYDSKWLDSKYYYVLYVYAIFNFPRKNIFTLNPWTWEWQRKILLSAVCVGSVWSSVRISKKFLWIFYELMCWGRFLGFKCLGNHVDLLIGGFSEDFEYFLLILFSNYKYFPQLGTEDVWKWVENLYKSIKWLPFWYFTPRA